MDSKIKLYTIGANGMQPVTTEGKNTLELGTVLQLNGYNHPKYVIVKNLGSDFRFPFYGTRYLVVAMDNHRESQFNASDLEFIATKKDDRIQTYITTEKVSLDQVLAMFEAAQAKKAADLAAQEVKERIYREKIESGRILATKYIPEQAQAVIIAELREDDSDVMTDYFSSRTTRTVVLAWSKTTRDSFSEMRKAAAKFAETKHYATAPTVNSSNEPKTENNKTWWNPKDEHREKYSMGKGYYLGMSAYSGWIIRKQKKYGQNWPDEIFKSLSEFNLLENNIS